MKPIRVLIADDNPVVRSGLVSVLEAAGDITVVGEAGNGGRAIQLAASLEPDLVLLDVRMPLVDGLAAVERLGRTVPVMMLTYTDDPDVVREAIRRGAIGYLTYGTFSSEELVDAVRGVVRNGVNPLSPAAVSVLIEAARNQRPTVPSDDARAGFGLSAREAEVMGHITQGKSNREIAAELFLTEKTVKNHVNRIFGKLAVTSRSAAIARWLGTVADR